MADQAYLLSLAPSARRAVPEGPPIGLPLAIATAVGEFLTGPLLEKPYLVGKPLTRELAGYTQLAAGRTGSCPASTTAHELFTRFAQTTDRTSTAPDVP